MAGNYAINPDASLDAKLEALLEKGEDFDVHDVEGMLHSDVVDRTTLDSKSSTGADDAGGDLVDGLDEQRAADKPDASTDDNGTATAAADKPADSSTAGADDAAAKPGDDGDGDAIDPSKAVVKTRDGKHEIPYTVLESTREQLRAAQEEVKKKDADYATLQQQIEELKNQQQQTAKDAGVTADAGKDGFLSDEQIEELRKQEYPEELITVMVTMRDQIKKQGEVIESFRTSTEESEAERAAREVQDDIDSVPYLTEIQAKGGDDWAKAVKIDALLAQHPLWEDKSRAERFREVARQMGAPADKLGGEVSDKPADTPKPPADKTSTDKKLDDALAAAGKGSVPNSHSDLPAGQAPAQSELQSLEGMDPVQLETMLEKMTPEQQDALLAKLG